MRPLTVPVVPPVLHEAVRSAHAVHDATAGSGFYDQENRHSLAALDPHGSLGDSLAGVQERREEIRQP